MAKIFGDIISAIESNLTAFKKRSHITTIFDEITRNICAIAAFAIIFKGFIGRNGAGGIED